MSAEFEQRVRDYWGALEDEIIRLGMVLGNQKPLTQSLICESIIERRAMNALQTKNEKDGNDKQCTRRPF
jgi:hypothetical protein